MSVCKIQIHKLGFTLNRIIYKVELYTEFGENNELNCNHLLVKKVNKYQKFKELNLKYTLANNKGTILELSCEPQL